MSEARQQTDLVAALQADDELSAVIRAHVKVEVQLNRLIDALLPYPEELQDSRMSWPQRIDIATALGLKNQYRGPLKKLGAIRNRFAHEPDSAISVKDVQSLFDSLSAEDKGIVLGAYKRTEQKADTPMETEFRQLQPRDQFTLIVVALHGAIYTAVREVLEQSDT